MEGPQHRRQDSERDINDLLLNGYYKTSRARSSSGSTPSTSRTTSFTNAPSFLQTIEDPEPPRRNRNTLDPEQAQRRSRNTLEAENRELTRHRSRSRSRAPRPPTGPPPPKPTCEDEVESLARELSSASLNSSDDEPPLRGIIEQYPIILEAEVTDADAARLHAEPRKEDETSNDNSERRFVFIPRTDTHSPTREDGYRRVQGDKTESDRDSTSSQDQVKREDKRAYIPTQPVERSRQRPESDRQDSHRTSLPVQPVERSKPTPDLVKEEKKLPIPGPPPLGRRRSSRQDLPALKTKEIPPQFRRTASAYASTAVEPDILKSTPRTARTASEYMLSPDITKSGRGGKGYFDSVASPRHHSNLHESSVPYNNGDTRSNGSSFSGASRPTTPSEKDKRASGSFDTRRNTNEKMTRPQQLTAENGAQRHLRTHSTHSEAPASPRTSPRTSEYSLRHYYSSSDDEVLHSSDSERRRRRHDRHHDHHKHSLRPVDDYSRPRRSPSSTRMNPFDAKVSSRYASPLPSPNVSPSQILRGDQFENNRSETFPRANSRRLSSRPVSPSTPVASNDMTPRASEPNLVDAPPRLKSRQSSGNASKPPSAAVSQTSLPLPIPTTPHVRSPIASQYNEPRSPSVRTPGEGKSYWQPPAFQPPTSSTNLEKPVGSYRRYSEDIERGSVAPLPTCPRTTYSRGHHDWLTLPQLKGFDICPSCYNSTMAKTEFRNHFIPAPRRPPDVEIICDFGSSPWYRIAWLLTLKERRRDLGLFYGLTEIATSVQPCLGKHDAIRQWHSIIDPRTGLPIRNFDVCTSCVKSVETLLPAIRGVLVRTDSHPAGPPRVCDLRFDSKRFVKYFDALETTANAAEEMDCAPDTREIAELAKHMSLIDECQHDIDVLDRRWYVITQLPEFTVCDECYDEIIYPLEQEHRKAIPAMFTKSSTRIPRASCQLYSPRMREVFEKAVQTDDYRYLASKTRERKTVELAYKANVADLKWRINNSGGLDSIGANSAVSRELNRLTEEWRKWE